MLLYIYKRPVFGVNFLPCFPWLASSEPILWWRDRKHFRENFLCFRNVKCEAWLYPDYFRLKLSTVLDQSRALAPPCAIMPLEKCIREVRLSLAIRFLHGYAGNSTTYDSPRISNIWFTGIRLAGSSRLSRARSSAFFRLWSRIAAKARGHI